jgi:hypothetical protein
MEVKEVRFNQVTLTVGELKDLLVDMPPEVRADALTILDSCNLQDDSGYDDLEVTVNDYDSTFMIDWIPEHTENYSLSDPESLVNWLENFEMRIEELA